MESDGGTVTAGTAAMRRPGRRDARQGGDGGMLHSTCQATGGCRLPEKAILPGPLYQKVDEFIRELPEKRGHLVTVLHKAQSTFGYLPVEVQQFVADRMNVSLAHVYGVVSFYTYFTMVPKGKFPISICMGTACFVKGADKIVNSMKESLGVDLGDVTPDGKFSIDTLRCVGGCALAPIVMVGERVFGNVTTGQIKKILADF
jgi:NADP-reducing hydrogenase subunit HndA